MVDTFSTDAEMRGLADIRHDLLPISSQPPYSLLLGGCDEIGNKSPLAVRAACSQSLLLAMSWHSSVSDVLSPYPPRPSPPMGEREAATPRYRNLCSANASGHPRFGRGSARMDWDWAGSFLCDSALGGDLAGDWSEVGFHESHFGFFISSISFRSCGWYLAFLYSPHSWPN